MTTPNLDRLLTALASATRDAVAQALDAAAERALRAVGPIAERPPREQALRGFEPDPHRAGPPHDPDFAAFAQGKQPTTPPGGGHPPILVLRVGTRGEINGITYEGAALPYVVETDTDPGPGSPPNTVIQRVVLHDERSAFQREILRRTP